MGEIRSLLYQIGCVMDLTNIAIVCSGKEISFGFNLLHLMSYKDENTNFMSDVCSIAYPNLYSLAAFQHTKPSPDTYCIYVGEAKQAPSDAKPVFHRFGMSVWKDGSSIIMCADPVDISGDDEYDRFLTYANLKRQEYQNVEAGYYKKVTDANPNWIAGEFKNLQPTSPWRKSINKRRLQQQYDCLSFVVYLEFLHTNEGRKRNDER